MSTWNVSLSCIVSTIFGTISRNSDSADVPLSNKQTINEYNRWLLGERANERLQKHSIDFLILVGTK